MIKKAAIYARVSTDEQSDRGYSLASQVENCSRFAERQGYGVADMDIYQDEVSGAIPVSSRPEGERLQSAIEERRIDSVVIYQIDRLSRDLIDLLITVRDWLRRGVKIYSVDVGQVHSENDIILVVRGWQGTDERAKIVERTNRGRYTKARQGKAVGSGVPPYGYNYYNGSLEINSLEAETVRLIFQWYTEGDENGQRLGMTAITDRLTNYGMPTPSQSKNRQIKHRRAPGVWDATTVMRIIQNETYCGVLRYGKNIGANGRGGKRPDSEHIVINTPAIISRSVWDAAQEQRERNNRIARRKSHRFYLLSGRIRCGCGYAIVGTHGRYYCPRRYWRRELEPCSEPSLSGKEVDSEAWKFVMRLVTDPIYFEDKLRQAQAEELAALEPKANKLDHVNALITQVECEAEELAHALRTARGIIRTKLEAQQDEINERYEALHETRVKLEKELSRQVLTDETLKDIRRFRETALIGLNNPTNEDMRRWIEILDVNVIVNNGQVSITCKLPTTDTVDMADNFKKFEEGTPPEVQAAGPRI